MAILLALQVALVRCWAVCIGDIRAAFLNGEEAPRKLFFKQPVRGLPGLLPGQLVEILKGVFGLSTFPKLWWLRLSRELLEIKFTEGNVTYFLKQNDIDPCVFQVMGRRDGIDEGVCGLILTHVDDLMVMADKEIHEKLKQEIGRRFPVDEWEADSFEYVGCEYQITEDEVNIKQTPT